MTPLELAGRPKAERDERPRALLRLASLTQAGWSAR